MIRCVLEYASHFIEQLLYTFSITFTVDSPSSVLVSGSGKEKGNPQLGVPFVAMWSL